MRILLIGAGISNAITSYLLRRQLGPNVKLLVFDKARNIGGRMTTNYDSDDNPSCSIDLGAQYLTVTKSNPITTKYFQQLLDDRVIELLDKKNTIGIRENPDKIDYTVPNGIASIVKYYFDRANVEMNLSKHIRKIDFNSDNNKFIVSTNNDQLDEGEVVIVTIPVPQLLSQMNGSIRKLIENNQDIYQKLNQVKYSTRYAVGLFYPATIDKLNIPWNIYYVDKNTNDCLRYLAVDNLKRNKNEPPFSVIAHTSVEFGEKYFEEDKVKIGEQIKENIFKFLPQLSHDVKTVKYHKWKYSQVTQAYSDHPGYIILNQNPFLVLSGDGFARESTFEALIESSIETVKNICALTH